MKITVYAVKYKGKWDIRLSVDIRVDMTWWLKGSDGQEDAVEEWVMLGRELPLPWGVKLCEVFKGSTNMKRWTREQWRQYVLVLLKDELNAEPVDANQYLSGGIDAISIWDEVQGWTSDMESERNLEEQRFHASNMMCGRESEERKSTGVLYLEQRRHSNSEIEKLDMECVARQADVLADVLSGRQLLVPEAEALLAEAAPGLENVWRSAAQLAYLQGRLSFAAGLASYTRRSAARDLRCNRCGSGAMYRTGCASCGSKACAYCETCLALGRSRECSLLLRGAAKPAVSRTADAAPVAELERWGLSLRNAPPPKRRCALAAPPGGVRGTPAQKAFGSGRANCCGVAWLHVGAKPCCCAAGHCSCPRQQQRAFFANNWRRCMALAWLRRQG